MEAIGVEISDVGLVAVAGHPARLQPVDGASTESPGYALPIKKGLLVGLAALEQSRLYPRQVNNRFWSQLSTYALPEDMAVVNNHAEMAFAHLQHLQGALQASQAPWFVTVPQFLDEPKLGILLGMLQELRIPVGGLVSGPVAGCETVPEGASALHVDVHLHTVEMVHLRQDDRLYIQNSHVVLDVGWHDFLDQIGKGLADEFVRATRFDPLHQASSEQQLYSQLLHMMWRKDKAERVTLELSSGQTTRSLTVLPQMLQRDTLGMRNKIVAAIADVAKDDGQVVVQLSHRAAMVPGLAEDIERKIGQSPIRLPVGASARGVLHMQGELVKEADSTGVVFVTTRKVEHVKPPDRVMSQKPAEVADRAEPTHVLYEDRAVPLGVTPIHIGSTPADGVTGILVEHAGEDVVADHLSIGLEKGIPTLRCTGTVWLGEEIVTQPCAVSLGQTIRFGAKPHEVRLIHVEPGHGA